MLLLLLLQLLHLLPLNLLCLLHLLLLLNLLHLLLLVLLIGLHALLQQFLLLVLVLLLLLGSSWYRGEEAAATRADRSRCARGQEVDKAAHLLLAAGFHVIRMAVADLDAALVNVGRACVVATTALAATASALFFIVVVVPLGPHPAFACLPPTPVLPFSGALSIAIGRG
jgi:hypothetical protein